MHRVLRVVVLLYFFVVASSLRRISHLSSNPADTEVISSNNTIHSRILAASSPEEHRVTNLPGLSLSLEQYAGHLVIDSESQSTIFYWLFPAATNADTAPLIIWMNGGPGCSSMDGLFLELGPLRLHGDSVEVNPNSWHHAGNLLFIDQPVGTGLSYTRRNTAYPKNDAEVNRDLYKAIIAFVTLHTKYASRDIYLTGESHAGHYIPSFAAYVAKKNAEGRNNGIVLHIAGLAIGNGWIDPYHQYDVSDYAHGHGIITAGQRNALKKKEAQCQRELDRKVYRSGVCFALLDDVIAASGTGGTGHLEMYDSRVYTKPGRERFPIGHTAVERYLNRDDVRTAIHATSTPHQFAECTDPPYNALAHQDGLGVMTELAIVLENKVPVLMFSGQYDIICHHLGTERALSTLEWSGKDEWLSAGTSIWVVDDHPAGYMKEYNNLQFLVVLDAGHMVPMSRPKEALDMITKFVNKQSFKSGGSKLTTLVKPELSCPSVVIPAAASSGARFNVDSTLPSPELLEAPIVDGNNAILRLNYRSGVAIVVEPEYRVLLVPTLQNTIQISSLPEGISHSVTIYNWNPSTNQFSQESISVDIVIGCGAKGGRKPCCGNGDCVVLRGVAQCTCSGENMGDFCDLLHGENHCNVYDAPLLSSTHYKPTDDLFAIDDYCQSFHLKGHECSVPMQFVVSSVDATKTPSYFTSLIQLLRDDLSSGCRLCKNAIRDVRVDTLHKDSLADVHFIVTGQRSQVQSAVYDLITQSYFSSAPLVQSSLLGSILRSHISISRVVGGKVGQAAQDNQVKLIQSSYVDWLGSPALIVLIVVGVYVANIAYRKLISRGAPATFRSGSRK